MTRALPARRASQAVRAARVTLVVMLVAPAPVAGQTTSAAPPEACAGVHGDGPVTPLDRAIVEAMRRNLTVGATLAVVQDGRTAVLRGYGCASLEGERPVDPVRTAFRIASVSKIFVATAVMRLVEDGRLDLNADVSDYVPGVRIPEAFDAPVTLGELLTHTAGFDERAVGYAARTLADVRPLGEYLAQRLPDRGWPPGRLTGYSNFGYALAAFAVESVRGEPFADVVEREIMRPLGMTSSTYHQDVPDSLASRMATGYRCTSTGCEALPVDYRSAYPPGGVVTTAGDMVSFMVAQLGGEDQGARILSDSMLRVMHARQFGFDPSLLGMTYGFAEDRFGGRRALSHGGGIPGFSSFLVLVPEARLGVFLSATGGSTRLGREVRDLVSAAFLPGADAPSDGGRDLAKPRVGPAGLAGPYRLTRYPHHTIENFALLFQGQLHVAPAGGDTIEVVGLGEADGRFVPTGAATWRAVDGNDVIGVRTDGEGQVTHLYGPLSFFGTRFPATYERLAWYDAPHFVNELLSQLLMVPVLLMGVVWPLTAGVGALIRRRRRARGLAAIGAGWSRTAWGALAAGVTFTVLAVLFGFGFVAQTVRQAERGGGDLLYGLPPFMVGLTWVPWALLVLAAGLVLAAAAGWRRRWWGVLRRVSLTVLALDAVGYVVLLVRWSFLPLRW